MHKRRSRQKPGWKNPPFFILSIIFQHFLQLWTICTQERLDCSLRCFMLLLVLKCRQSSKIAITCLVQRRNREFWKLSRGWIRGVTNRNRFKLATTIKRVSIHQEFNTIRDESTSTGGTVRSEGFNSLVTTALGCAMTRRFEPRIRWNHCLARALSWFAEGTRYILVRSMF